jgi:predicted nucleic acid-binding protein
VPYVLDASIAACWCFKDEQSEKADLAFDLLEADYALVPALWWFEVRNIVLVGERRNRTSTEEVNGFLDRLGRMTISISVLPQSSDVIDLARQHRLSFYDAAYLELAKREAMPLATLDKTLVDAARAEEIALI